MSAANCETGEIFKADVIDYRVHPVAALLPSIEGEAFKEFVEDIRRNGQREPVVLDANGVLIDGRNRARACRALGLEVKETRYSGDDVENWIISHNVHRRHLTTSQKSMFAARLATLKWGTNRYSQKVEGSFEPSTSEAAIERSAPSIVKAAKQLGVARESVKRARAVIQSGNAELIESVDAGRKTVTAAAAEIRQASEPRKAPRPSRAAKVESLRGMAERGYSSAQMQKELGYSAVQQVRALAREFGIEIPADKALGRQRRIDWTAAVEKTVYGLEDTVEFIANQLDLTEVDYTEADKWLSSLTHSLSELRRFQKQIKENSHV